jgi:hypothetical protein
MTQKVCFEFCRTVPEMLFFGIVNGRNCYCAPYFKPMAGDSSDCDAVCEGEPAAMCGGKTKSSIFGMHMCASTESDLAEAASKAGDLSAELEEKAADGAKAAGAMQNAGDAGQKLFGSDGNPGASNLHQNAKVFAGKLEHASAAVADAHAALKEGQASSKKLKKFSDPSVLSEAEALMESFDKDGAKAEEVAETLDELLAAGTPQGDAGDAAAQYYNVMYFVDQKLKDAPSTCTGDAAAEPMVGASMDECAAHCDAQGVGSCVGFSRFNTGEHSLCFFFKNFKTAVYYTGCKDDAKQEVQCVAKLSEYEGTTLKPDKSGKCKQCLKEAKKADRCYK